MIAKLVSLLLLAGTGFLFGYSIFQPFRHRAYTFSEWLQDGQWVMPVVINIMLVMMILLNKRIDLLWRTEAFAIFNFTLLLGVCLKLRRNRSNPAPQST